MGKMSKEDQAYLNGMEFALKICKRFPERPMTALEQELMYRRGNHPVELQLPRNIDRQSLAGLAIIQPELEAISVALATAIVDVAKLTPTRQTEFLVAFNNGVDLYRHDEEAKQKAMAKLDASWGLQEVSKKYMSYYKERIDERKEEEK